MRHLLFVLWVCILFGCAENDASIITRCTYTCDADSCHEVGCWHEGIIDGEIVSTQGFKQEYVIGNDDDVVEENVELALSF